MRILKQSHSAEKLEKRDPLGFLKLQFAAQYQKNLKGTLWRQESIQKKSYSAEKKSKNLRKSKNVKNWPILVKFGPILAMFLKSRLYDFDAFAHIGL